jgi:hypothetical protein
VPRLLTAATTTHLEQFRWTMSTGQFALEVLDACDVEDVPLPPWVLDEILTRYRAFRDGAPDHGWTCPTKAEPAARSLGEAFGVADIERAHGKKRHLRAPTLPKVLVLFNGPDALPRTVAGYAKAAQALGITMDQVKKMAP